MTVDKKEQGSSSNKASSLPSEQQQLPGPPHDELPHPCAAQGGGDEESVTDLYTTDGTTTLGAASGSAVLGKGGILDRNDNYDDDDEVYLDAGGRLSDEAFREQVRLEQDRVFRDYQLEVPTPFVVAPGPSANANNDDDDTSEDDESLMTNTIDGDTTAGAPPQGGTHNKKGDADARSVLTDNPIFRAAMEAEERRLMAEFDFDYSVKSSFDQFDAYDAPGSDAASGSGGKATTSAKGTGLPPLPPPRAGTFPPLARSVATEADMDAASTLPDYSLAEGQGGGEPRVVVMTVGDDDKEGGTLAKSGIGGGANPSKSASSSLSSFRSMPFMNTLRILLPSAVVSSAVATPRRRDNNAADLAFSEGKPTPTTNSSGGSDTSPTSKSHTHAATDSKPNETHSPSRSGGSRQNNADQRRVPPSIIILGTIDKDDDPNDITLGDQEIELGLNVVKSLSNEPEAGGEGEGGLVRKAARRLWGDWFRRVIVLLVLAMLLSIGVAVGGLVVYRNSQAASASSAVAPDVSNAPPVSPPFTNGTSTGNTTDVDDDFFRPPAENSTMDDNITDATNVPKPPDVVATTAPSAAPVMDTKKPVSTEAPTKLRATKSPTSEPSVAAPPPPQDEVNATAVVDATPEPTTAPSLQPSLASDGGSSSTNAPSSVPTSGGSGSVETILRSILASVAPTSIMNRLDDGSSTAPSNALAWLVQDVESYGGLDKQIIQRYSLATAAYSFQSDNWDSSSDWLNSDVSECEWYGVSCDDSGSIVSIDLESNGLQGSIPPELSLLSSSLTRVAVSDNSISGKFPVELTSLQYLDTFLMANNNVGGSIPTQIGVMESLGRWHLERNSMTGSVPSQVGNLTNLQEFYIWGNQFTGVSSDVCALDGLDFMVDCDMNIDCYTRCYYTCGGDSGVECRNRALLGDNVVYEST